MSKFRIKHSASVPSRHNHTPQINQQQHIPFSNKKLKDHIWQQDGLSIKRLKSNIQISRKKYQFIPNLKKIKLDNQKISIVKTYKNQYNVFLKFTSQKQKNKNIDFINGNNHKKDILRLFHNSKLQVFNTLYSQRSNHSFIFAQTFDRLTDSTNIKNISNNLHISGELKQLSPSRSGDRIKYKQIKQKIIL